MAELRIHILGSLEVRVDGELLDESRWPRKKAKTLLKLLALTPSRQLHREQLIEILWPDTDADLALNNFHKSVHAARRALEPDLKPGVASQFLLTVEERVAFADGVWIDCVEFEREAQAAFRTHDAAALDTARRLYRGELLEENRYDDWTTVRREQLRSLHQRVLERLASVLDESGERAGAIAAFEQVVAANPINENAYRSLMRLYAVSGQRHLALDQFERCSDALRAELDTEPEAATRALFDQIVGAGLSRPALPVAAPASAATEGSRPAKPASVVPAKWLSAAAMVLFLAAIAIAASMFFKPTKEKSVIDSLAVLALSSGGELSELGYVGEGIAESVINGISQMPGIRVMARSTAFRYRNSAADPRAIGKELHVGAVLTGSVSQRGDTVFVSAELVNVTDGSQLWGQRYSLPAKDLNQVPQRLGSQIVAAIRGKVSPEQQRQLNRRSTNDPEAYKLYLRGRYFLNVRSDDSVQKGIEYFQQAIVRDPNYAQAYAGLADGLGLSAFRAAPPAETMAKIRAAANRAIELDPELPEAHTSLGMVHALYDWDWRGAEAEFRRAIQLNPGYATAHHWFAVHLCAMGRLREAAAEFTKALEVDPLSPIIVANSAYPIFYQRKYSEAVEIFKKSLELNPAFGPVHEDLMTAYSKLGQNQAAVDEASAWLRSLGQTEMSERLRLVNAEHGPDAAWRLWLGELERRTESLPVRSTTVAQLHLVLGDREMAIRVLERAYGEHSPVLTYAMVDPRWDALRADPRFKDLLRRLNLPPQ